MQTLLPVKIERAFHNYYLSASYSSSGAISSSFTFERPLNIYQGLSNQDKAAPCVIITAQGSQEVVLHTGVMRCPVTITVKEMAADLSSSNLGALADLVFDLALTSSFSLPSWDTYGGLGVMDTVITDLQVRPEGDCWSSTLFIDVIAAHG